MVGKPKNDKKQKKLPNSEFQLTNLRVATMRVLVLYGQISQMTYQPRSIGIMADFELSPSVLFKFKSNVYLFLQGLSYRVSSVPTVKNWIPNRHPFSY